ncbi:Predicted beta-glucoside-regulated ABC transport system, permease component 2, COG0395 [[Actinomadura] parvosata subsp. kistnae]|uniref:ABC transporter permease n=1 Tax=[Actinomadura] parvosata subsp. kistnae TaxID=1909395 RepID=A0A1V0AG69_9ACTN|nr:carbohydrate ABC transporter permease [Nonomuraea sp. ATCC 55076]AQZ69200.1 ABC transporter permease [Nonomuraea sp. ATCC 55076]SPL92194.1 Predicted beta-glucoside-regulated ABC transport system, permease component 2, COG0395 [Actinomadura parvosata subsp. kistnae]
MTAVAGRRAAVFGWARFGVLALFVVIFLIPIYVLLVTSFKPLTEADPGQAWNLPRVWTTEAWQVAWEKLAPGLWNSVLLAVPGSLLSCALGSMNGYVLSKWRFPGADVLFTLFLFGMFIPYQGVMIPLVQLLVSVDQLAGLQGVFYGGIPGLVLAHVVYGIPICTLIFRNYYVTIPDELIEASRVDGAGMLRAYWSVVLPVSGPAIAVVIIWQFTSLWNDFLFAVFLTGPTSWPTTVMLNNIAGAQATPYSQQMAAAILASVPTMLIYILLGRFFMRGLMAGALKG